MVLFVLIPSSQIFDLHLVIAVVIQPGKEPGGQEEGNFMVT